MNLPRFDMLRSPKRNDRMLDCIPASVVVFPGTGIQDILAEKARKVGIPVYRVARGSVSALPASRINISGMGQFGHSRRTALGTRGWKLKFATCR